ncbi:MAG TPA: TolC family protein [Abditibacteriaceae bacterium]
MSHRLILLSILLATPLPAQETAPVAPVPGTPVGPLPEAPPPGDLSQPTPPIVPPTPPVVVPPPVVLPAPPTGEEVSTEALPNEPLSADEAARIALRLQPDIAIANADLLAAQGRRAQARSGLRPSFGVTAGYTQQRSLSNTGGGGGGGGAGTPDTFSASSSNGLRVTASVRQLLFDFNRTRDAVRAATLREQAANTNISRVQSDLVLTIKQAFYAFVENGRLVEVNEANLQNRQAQLALAQARLQSGLGAPADVVRAQTAVAQAVFELESARNLSSTSRVNLALLMGVDPRTPIVAENSTEPVITANDVNELVNMALTQRPETLQAQTILQAAQTDVNVARKTNRPSLGIGASAGSRTAAFGLGNGSVRATLDLQWTPFDGGLTRGLVREAQAGVLTAQAELTRVRQTIVSDVSQAYLNLRTAEQRVVAAEAGVANAEESVRIAEGRYRAGVAAFIEVTDAQTALITARTNRVNALSQVDQARAALRRALGEALPPAAAP